MNLEKVLAVIVGFVMATCSMSCGRESGSLSGKTGGVEPSADIITQNKGRIVVALFGMEGCSATETATRFLSELSKTKAEGIKICRVDVPPPGKAVERVKSLDPGIEYVVDNGRRMAGRLGFFFYPTLYIFDRDGIIRFSGGCEPDKVRVMISELSAEPSDAPKKMYNKPQIKAGDIVEDFNIPDADGKAVSLASLCEEAGVILLFGNTTCSFSMEAVDDLERLKKDFAAAKLAWAVLNIGQSADKIRDVYDEKAPGRRLLVDADGSLSAKYFGVTAVPFYSILDRDRKVYACGPFVYDAVRSAFAQAQDQTEGAGSDSGATGAG